MRDIILYILLLCCIMALFLLGAHVGGSAVEEKYKDEYNRGYGDGQYHMMMKIYKDLKEDK